MVASGHFPTSWSTRRRSGTSGSPSPFATALETEDGGPRGGGGKEETRTSWSAPRQDLGDRTGRGKVQDQLVTSPRDLRDGTGGKTIRPVGHTPKGLGEGGCWNGRAGGCQTSWPAPRRIWGTGRAGGKVQDQLVGVEEDELGRPDWGVPGQLVTPLPRDLDLGGGRKTSWSSSQRMGGDRGQQVVSQDQLVVEV